MPLLGLFIYFHWFKLSSSDSSLLPKELAFALLIVQVCWQVILSPYIFLDIPLFHSWFWKILFARYRILVDRFVLLFICSRHLKICFYFHLASTVSKEKFTKICIFVLSIASVKVLFLCLVFSHWLFSYNTFSFIQVKFL